MLAYYVIQVYDGRPTKSLSSSLKRPSSIASKRKKVANASVASTVQIDRAVLNTSDDSMKLSSSF
jgi:hypothetical protein